MVARVPATMSFLWCLALPLFFCCWEAGAPRSSAGPRGSGHTELPAVTPELWTSSEEVFQATDLTEPAVPNHVSWETQTLSIQTSDGTFIRGGTVSEAETREDKTMALMTRKPSKFTAVITTPTATSSTGGSPMARVRTTVDTVTGSELWKVVFENLCTLDSSEEAKRILKFTHISAEAEAPSSESSASSDSSVPAVTTSQAQSADITALTKALVTYITNTKVINCRVMETEPTAAIPGTSHIDRSSAGGQALSPPERSALPDSTEAKSHLTRNTTSVETWTIAHATESVTPAVTVILSSTPEKETTAAKATTPSGTLVTVSKNLLEESSGLSVETTSDTSISGIITVFTEDATTVSEATSPAEFSAMVYSFSEETSTVSFTSSETSTTHSTFSGPIPTISRSSLPSSHLPMVDSIPETTITSSKTTASANSTPETSVSSTKTTASANSSSETSISSTKTTASANSTPETSVSSTKTTASANSTPETSISSTKTTASANSTPETSISSTKTTASANSTPETSISSTKTTASANSTPETSVSSTKTTASANSSSETSVTSAKTTDSAKTLKTASAGGGKPSATLATPAQTRWTDIPPGADGGFLLLRLSVASLADLTDPRVAERLMPQLSNELEMLTFPVHISLLRVRSG